MIELQTGAKLFALLNRKEKFQAAGLIGLMFIGAGFEALGLGLLMPFISLLNRPDLIQEKPALRRIYEALGMATPQQFIIYAAFGLLLFYIVKNASLAVLYFFQFRFVYARQVEWSRRLFGNYLRRPYAYHLQRNTAELLRNVTNEVFLATHNVMTPYLVVLSESIAILVILGFLIFLDPAAALAAVGAIGSMAYLFFRIVRRKTDEMGKVQQDQTGQMIKWVNQGLGSIKETKVLGCEQFFIDSFTESVYRYSRAQRFMQTTNAMPRLLIETLAILAMLTIVISMLVRGHSIVSVLPVLAMFAAAAFRLLPSINRIAGFVHMIRFNQAAVDVVHRDLTLSDACPEPAGLPLPNSKPAENRTPFRNAIELRDVVYRYPETEADALKGISIKIPRGASAAFIGPSGAGKTTLIDIILGLLKPSSGQILVDGRSIHEDLGAWQRKLGYIPQTLYLFDDSIRRNVAFGVPDDQIDDAKVWAALESAQLKGLLEKMPKGLDTEVGERGIRISGGERQRIGIARCLYHDPEILVLDEATSALDSVTEDEISRTIQSLSGQKTLLIIAHRLSTVKACGIVFSVHDGTLDEDASPCRNSPI